MRIGLGCLAIWRRSSHSLTFFFIISRGGIVDGRATELKSQTGHGDDTYAFAAADDDVVVVLGSVFRQRVVYAERYGYIGHNFHPVGDVRVVAGIL